MNRRSKEISSIILLTCIAGSCTRYSAIPPSDYLNIEHFSRHGYRVRTVDKQSYIVSRFSVQDNSLVVLEFKPNPGELLPATPFIVPLNKVDRIETIEVEVLVPTLAVLTVIGLLWWIGHLAVSHLPVGD